MRLRSLLLTLVLAFFAGIQENPAQKIKTVDFNQLEPILNRVNDSVYVINFWAMWCKPCVEELPVFERVRRSFADKKVRVVLVSMDFGSKIEERLQVFMERKQVYAEVTILDDPDANSWIDRVDASWDGAIPATVVYGNGQRKFFGRKITFPELEEAIDQMIVH